MANFLTMYAANVGGFQIAEVYFSGTLYRYAKGYEEGPGFKVETTDLVLVQTGDAREVYAIIYLSAYNYIGGVKTYADAVKGGDNHFQALAMETTTTIHGTKMDWDGAKFVLAHPAESPKSDCINAKNIVGVREATDPEAKIIYALLQQWPEFQGETDMKYVLVN